MRTVEIPGGTARVRDVREEIKIRQQRILDTAVIPAIPAFNKARAERDQWEQDGGDVRLSTLTRQESVALMEFQDAQMVALLHSWTLERPLPDVDTIQDLEPDLYQALLEATREIQNTTEVFARDNMDPSPEEESPTVPSSDSKTGSRNAKSGKSKETAKSSTASKNTGTESSTPA